MTLNTHAAVLDQLADSKLFKKTLERQLGHPTVAGLDLAVSQLLMDWGYLFGWVPACACPLLGGCLSVHAARTYVIGQGGV